MPGNEIPGAETYPCCQICDVTARIIVTFTSRLFPLIFHTQGVVTPNAGVKMGSRLGQGVKALFIPWSRGQGVKGSFLVWSRANLVIKKS